LAAFQLACKLVNASSSPRPYGAGFGVARKSHNMSMAVRFFNRSSVDITTRDRLPQSLCGFGFPAASASLYTRRVHQEPPLHGRRVRRRHHLPPPPPPAAPNSAFNSAPRSAPVARPRQHRQRQSHQQQRHRRRRGCCTPPAAPPAAAAPAPRARPAATTTAAPPPAAPAPPTTAVHRRQQHPYRVRAAATIGASVRISQEVRTIDPACACVDAAVSERTALPA